MQRFVAELTAPIEKSDFERSWHSDPKLGPEPKVEFAFAGRRVSVTVHSEDATKWPMVSFQRSFSAAIRRLNSVCNVRWI